MVRVRRGRPTDLGQRATSASVVRHRDAADAGSCSFRVKGRGKRRARYVGRNDFCAASSAAETSLKTRRRNPGTAPVNTLGGTDWRAELSQSEPQTRGQDGRRGKREERGRESKRTKGSDLMPELERGGKERGPGRGETHVAGDEDRKRRRAERRDPK